MAEEDEVDLPGLSASSKKLYTQCRATQLHDGDNFRRVFYQEDLLQSSQLKVEEVLKSIHELDQLGLFISLKQQGKVCWCTRRSNVAAQVRSLDKTERMVYQVIEESHLDGVWIKKIKQKTGIQDNSVEKMVHRFMGMGLIQCIRHIKAPLQKTYMLSHLVPGDEVTGGTFYEQGDLDEMMVKELGNVIILQVRKLSWMEEKRKKFKTEYGVSAVDDRASVGVPNGTGRAKKRKSDALLSTDIEDTAILPRSLPAKRAMKSIFDLEPHATHLQLAYPAGHHYPTADDVRKYIDETGLLRRMGNHRLTVQEVQQIVNVLVWDEKLEEINGGYRTVRGVRERPGHGYSEEEVVEQERDITLGNSLTEMPCGRCPVIDLCGVGGPVNAETCVQYEHWLKML